MEASWVHGFDRLGLFLGIRSPVRARSLGSVSTVTLRLMPQDFGSGQFFPLQKSGTDLNLFPGFLASWQFL